MRCGHPVSHIEANRLHLDNGDTNEFDACFVVTAVAPPAWLRQTGLELDAAGFIAVDPTLQSRSHPNIFAAGDIAMAMSPAAKIFGCERDWSVGSTAMKPAASSSRPVCLSQAGGATAVTTKQASNSFVSPLSRCRRFASICDTGCPHRTAQPAFVRHS